MNSFQNPLMKHLNGCSWLLNNNKKKLERLNEWASSKSLFGHIEWIAHCTHNHLQCAMKTYNESTELISWINQVHSVYNVVRLKSDWKFILIQGKKKKKQRKKGGEKATQYVATEQRKQKPFEAQASNDLYIIN